MTGTLTNQQDYDNETEIKFSIHRESYTTHVVISLIFVIAAVLLFLFGITGVPLPFAGIFLVWGGDSLRVLLESPVFRLTGDALSISRSQSGDPLRLPLASLTTITSWMVSRPHARTGTIAVANPTSGVIIPRRLTMEPAKILRILVERTTRSIEKSRNVHQGQTPPPGNFPPPELARVIRNFQEEGQGEKVFLFNGPVKKISLSRRLYRKIILALYLMSMLFGITDSKDIEEFFLGAVLISILFAIFFLLGYLFTRIKGAEWLLVFPAGIAIVGRKMKGELLWHEARGVKYIGNRGLTLSITGAQKSPTGLLLLISARDSISIPIPDLYDAPLPCIERILTRYARNAGARL